MRTIIARFEIDDNDLIEHKLFTILDSMGCKDFKKLPDTKELYEKDENFRKLAKAKKKAQRDCEIYINNSKLKK